MTKSVVHLSTSDNQGGAAISAWRLHQGLQRIGIDSRVVCRQRNGDGEDVSTIHSPLFDSAELFHQRKVVPAQEADATFFSLSAVSLPLLDHPWIANADVIHLHWVAFFLAPEDIQTLCDAGKTVFWTFHDQWPYTGGCHYIGGVTRKESDWNGTSQIGPTIHPFAQMELSRKRKAFTGAPIHVIAPSQWIAAEAEASGLFSPERIHVIPYGINTEIFFPNSREVQDDKVRLLFGCQNLGERRKGFRELRQALEHCMQNREFAQAVNEGRIIFTTFGMIPAQGIELPLPATHLGPLASEEQVAETLRASSVFICPTLEDNLPNVVMESLSCGCPVISFMTGGVPDMVTHGKNGLLASKGDIKALASYLIDFCLNSDIRNQLLDGAKMYHSTAHSLETQASKIEELYSRFHPHKSNQNNFSSTESIPSITLNASLIPHFGTEIAILLVDEIATIRSQYSAVIADLQTTLGDTLKQACSASDQVSVFKQQLDETHQQLHETIATHAKLQLKTNNLELKLKRNSESIKTLKQRLEHQKELNQKLRIPPKRKSYLHRLRRFFAKRLKKD